MPPRIRVEVNAPALRDFLRNLPEARDGVQTVASDIAAVAREHVPVVTGRLRDSIGTRRTMSKGQEGDTVRVEATAPYAQFVELGTRNMPPQPFLRPSAARYRQNTAAHYKTVRRRSAARKRRAAGA